MVTINFKGKSYVQNHHLTLKYHHLVPDPAASLTEKISLHDNLIIHGENLLALKALLPTYAGKVYLLYQPDLNYLRSTSLDLHKAEKLGLPKPNCKNDWSSH